MDLIQTKHFYSFPLIMNSAAFVNLQYRVCRNKDAHVPPPHKNTSRAVYPLG